MLPIITAYLAGLATFALICVGWFIYQTIRIDIEQNREAYDDAQAQARHPDPRRAL